MEWDRFWVGALTVISVPLIMFLLGNAKLLNLANSWAVAFFVFK